MCHQFMVMKVMMAMRYWLVYGYKRRDVCTLLELNNGYFSVSLSRLARVNQLFTMVFPYYTSGSRSYEGCINSVFGQNWVEVLSDVQ